MNDDSLWKLLTTIDDVLESYDPGEPRPDSVARDIIAARARQRPLLEQAIRLATEGLADYPCHPELLRRRAWARCHVVTPDGVYPQLEEAERDLRLMLKLDPDNLPAGLDLLEAMFTHSGMADREVAEVAEELASRAERILLSLRALQIKALGYADEHEKAQQVYDRCIRIFPDAKRLQAAKEDADSMRVTEERTGKSGRGTDKPDAVG